MAKNKGKGSEKLVVNASLVTDKEQIRRKNWRDLQLAL